VAGSVLDRQRELEEDRIPAEVAVSVVTLAELQAVVLVAVPRSSTWERCSGRGRVAPSAGIEPASPGWRQVS
jgi:hypothetical protein